MMGIDDEGKPYELAPDPMNAEMGELLRGVELGKPETLGDKLVPLLSNEELFFVNLYEAGIGGLVEDFVREMLEGKGAVRKTVKRVADVDFAISLP